MEQYSYVNVADVWHKKWLADVLGNIVAPQYYGPDLIGNNIAIELKAKLREPAYKHGFDILTAGFENIASISTATKLYAFYYYRLKKSVKELQTEWQVYTNIFGREVYFVDFDFVDLNKSEKKTYGIIRSNDYFYLSPKKITNLVNEMLKRDVLETATITTFGLEDKIYFCTENADQLKKQIKHHPRFVRNL